MNTHRDNKMKFGVLFSIIGFIIYFKWYMKTLLTYKCSIHLELPYCVIKY
jgi:hypothetical protein